MFCITKSSSLHCSVSSFISPLELIIIIMMITKQLTHVTGLYKCLQQLNLLCHCMQWLHYSLFGYLDTKSDPNYCCRQWRLAFLPTGDRVEGGAAVCPGRFTLRLLTRCGSISASKVTFDAAHISRAPRDFSLFPVPQVAAEMGTAVREVEEALQLLQERVMWPLSDHSSNRRNEGETMLKCWFRVYSCLAA